MKTTFTNKQIQILQVAEMLFAEKGFDGTSIRDIAKEAKINVAMVSYYFGSKELLLEALVIFRVSEIKKQLDILILEELQPLEKINKLIEMYINRINDNRCMYQILHFEVSSSKRKINMQAFTELKKENLKSMEAIILEGQEKGIFKKDINIPLLPSTMLGPYFHFNLNRSYYEELFGLDTEEKYNNYIKTTLTMHIQQTIKALLIYES
ncbi:TetR/AcrR family transcriptional regulator [Flavobacterium sp.]|uniref:TetR/AcrR family transcriptional regulator n=1 Tax=Flavobacterium sp. TaxID=239 RepID=UPI002B635F1B|nr:TetR family transcriptional regulator [Flavobacterium sp.]HSD07862.1 TetR family transcriptional regulator [Flavobacterium sp.]